MTWMVKQLRKPTENEKFLSYVCFFMSSSDSSGDLNEDQPRGILTEVGLVAEDY